MNGDTRERSTDVAELVRAYGEAFERRDLEGCVDFFDEQATIRFLFATYQGREAIRQWHADRFAADVRLMGMEEARVDGASVSVDAQATSRRLRLFRIDKVKGTVTFQIAQGRFTEAKFTARSGSAGHLDWQFR